MNIGARGSGGFRAVVVGLASIGLAGLLGADDPDQRTLLQAKRSLARIGVEMHRYRAEHGRKFPPAAIRSKDGRPLLSWRVALLPLLGEEELYRQFRLDEPWDSPANKPLLARMPAVYAPFGPRESVPGATHFQAIVGRGTLFEDAVGHDFAAVPDGGDATLIVVEAAEAVPWTRPSDLVYEAKGALPRLGGEFKGGSLGLFADGSVAFIRRDIDEPTLRALMTRDAADPVARRTLRNHVIPIRR